MESYTLVNFSFYTCFCRSFNRLNKVLINETLLYNIIIYYNYIIIMFGAPYFVSFNFKVISKLLFRKVLYLQNRLTKFTFKAKISLRTSNPYQNLQFIIQCYFVFQKITMHIMLYLVKNVTILYKWEIFTRWLTIQKHNEITW